MPLNVQTGTELRDDALSILMSKKFMQLLQLTIGTYEVAAVVTPDE